MKHVEVLNHALANVPPERVRMHVCWGNYEGPHHYDVPLADIADIVFSARPASVSFEAANPRHAHEWALFEMVKLPEGKILIPSVVESKSNFIEHPELIANRISNYARLVGRENVVAGSDCGYGTWVGQEFLVQIYEDTNQDAAMARQDSRLSEFLRLAWQSESGCHHRDDILVAGLLDREASCPRAGRCRKSRR
jgi:methionine synthase II (cobalamin-independent)